MARLYGRAGRLTAQNGDFRPGQKQALEALFIAADAALPGKPVTVNYTKFENPYEARFGKDKWREELLNRSTRAAPSTCTKFSILIIVINPVSLTQEITVP